MQAKTYNKIKVLTPHDIDKICGYELIKNGNKGKKKSYSGYMLERAKKKANSILVEGEDYIFLPSEPFKAYKGEDEYNYPRGGNIITLEGYKKVFKEVGYNDKVLEYFGVKPEKKTPAKKEVSAEPDVKGDVSELEVVVNNTDANNTEFLNTIKAMFDAQVQTFNKIMDLQNQFIQNEREANKELREIIKDMVAGVSIANDNKEAINNIQSIVKEMNDVDYSAWRKKIVEACNKVVAKNAKFKSTESVLSEAYKLLRKDYGLVWEQEKKDYYQATGDANASTLKIYYWIEQTKPQYTNMLMGKLNTIYSGRE